MTTNEIQRIDLMMQELTECDGPYAFLKRFDGRRTVKERSETMTLHVMDVSIVIDGLTYWAVIGRGMPTSFDCTLRALDDLRAITWNDCEIECDPMTREIIVRIRTSQVAAA